MDFDEVKAHASRLSPWAHLASVGPDGDPHVVPVHPAFDGTTVWVMVGLSSVKAGNVGQHPGVMLHWQVDETGDGLMIWGRAAVHDDQATKQRLWTGVFDYDLDLFAPGGPDASPDTGFLSVEPTKATFLAAYGINGRFAWAPS